MGNASDDEQRGQPPPSRPILIYHDELLRKHPRAQGDQGDPVKRGPPRSRGGSRPRMRRGCGRRRGHARRGREADDRPKLPRHPVSRCVCITKNQVAPRLRRGWSECDPRTISLRRENFILPPRVGGPGDGELGVPEPRNAFWQKPCVQVLLCPRKGREQRLPRLRPLPFGSWLLPYGRISDEQMGPRAPLRADDLPGG